VIPFDVRAILDELARVDAERARRQASPTLTLQVHAIKAYQQRRFSHTYADLLASERYRSAARFFLDELYGPRDFTQRDAQFARVVPALVRLFPQDIVDVVGTLARLHALSEQLDTTMADHLTGTDVDAARYRAAWQATGEPTQRALQVELTLEVGSALDRLVRQPLLRQTLRMMRGPARLAGLADLQVFLERGFDTFRAMRGAQQFLDWVGQRERALVEVLFGAEASDEARSRELLPP
jgi:hypothetical protein